MIPSTVNRFVTPLPTRHWGENRQMRRAVSAPPAHPTGSLDAMQVDVPDHGRGARPQAVIKTSLFTFSCAVKQADHCLATQHRSVAGMLTA